MPEPEHEKSDENVERHVVYETVSSSSTRSSAITIGAVVLLAIALIVFIVMQMR